MSEIVDIIHLIKQVILDSNLAKLYGVICIKPYNYNQTYGFTGLKENTSLCVKETVAEHSVNCFEYKSKQLQYKKFKKNFTI